MVSQMAKEDRKKREKENRKQTILKSALYSFAKHGYHKCSMDLIAEEAELGKATLYYYFKNKDELLLEVLKTGLELFFENMTKAWESLEDTREKIEAISITAGEFFAEHPDYFRLYLYLSTHPKLNKITSESLRPLVQNKNKVFIRLFKKAVKEKLVKPIPPQNLVNVLGTLIMGVGMFGHYKRKSDIKKRMKLINEIFFNGVLLDKKK